MGVPPAAVMLAAVMAVVLFATAWNYGPFGDEFYYIDCGRHLAAGYVDHPPLVAFVAFAAGKILGGSYIVLRVIAALAAAASVLLVSRISARLGGGRFAQSLAALAMVAAPGFWAIFSFYSMNALDMVIVSIAILILIDILDGGPNRRWLALGAAVGIGLLNKLTLLPFGFAALAGLLATRHRAKLASPWPWAAGAIAGLFFLPYIAWQMRHGWPTVEFISLTRQNSINPLTAAGYLMQLALGLNPVLAPLWITGLVSLLSGWPRRTGRALGILALAFIAVYAMQQAKVYYVFPIMPLLLAAGAVAIERFSAKGTLGWIRPSAVALAAATGIALLPFGVPVLPVDGFIPYGKATGLVAKLKIHKSDRVDLPVHFALRFGWREMVASTANAFESLSEEERTGCVIVTNDYSKAGAVNYYRGEFVLPEALSGHNSYRYWLPEDISLRVVIAVGLEEAYLKRYFRDIELFAVHRHSYAAPWETDQEIFIGREPLRSWEEIRRDMHWY